MSINRAQLHENIGGDLNLLREMHTIFRSEAPSLLGALQAAVARKDAQALVFYAHRLKGAVLNFAAEPAADQAYRLEELGRSQALEGAPPALRELELELARLNEALFQLSAVP